MYIALQLLQAARSSQLGQCRGRIVDTQNLPFSKLACPVEASNPRAVQALRRYMLSLVVEKLNPDCTLENGRLYVERKNCVLLRSGM